LKNLQNLRFITYKQTGNVICFDESETQNSPITTLPSIID